MKKEKQKQPAKKAGTVKTEKKKSQRIYYAILFFFAVVLYSNTFNLEYAFDDAAVITGNQYTLKGFKGIPALMTKDLFAGVYGTSLEIGGGRYRPLTLVTYAIEYQLSGGLNPTLSHIVNILLFGLLAMLIFATFRLIMPNANLVSFLATLLFVAHPIHTEVVANIKSRDEILSLMGIMGMFYFMFRYFKSSGNSNRVLYLILSGLFYFLSLLSKENGITFLAIIPLTIYCFTNLPLKKIVKVYIPFFIIAAIYFALRTYLVGTLGDKSSKDIMENPFVNTGFAERMATIFCILGKYMLLLFFPHPLSADYSYNEIPIIGWTSWKALLPFAIYIALIVYSLINIRKKDWIAYGILFYLISMSLVSNIFFNIGAPMGERFEFLPSLGFCLAISIVILKLLKIDNWKEIKMPVKLAVPVGIVLVLFSIKTFSRNFDWKNNETIFGADVHNTPNSAKVHYYYGNTMLKKGMDAKDPEVKSRQLAIAESETWRSLAINPAFFHAYYNLGLIYEQKKMGDSAVLVLRKTLQLEPGYGFAIAAIGGDYGKLLGQYDSAIFYLKKAVSMNPNDAKAYGNLGIAYAMKKQLPEAVDALQRAVNINPNDAEMNLNLAVAYDNQGDKTNANIYYNKAFALDPTLKK